MVVVQKNKYKCDLNLYVGRMPSNSCAPTLNVGRMSRTLLTAFNKCFDEGQILVCQEHF